MSLLGHDRYYRDPAQPAPQSEEVEEGRGERVALDPEALLREAEENVENLDEVSPLPLVCMRGSLCGRVSTLATGTARLASWLEDFVQVRFKRTSLES